MSGVLAMSGRKNCNSNINHLVLNCNLKCGILKLSDNCKTHPKGFLIHVNKNSVAAVCGIYLESKEGRLPHEVIKQVKNSETIPFQLET